MGSIMISETHCILWDKVQVAVIDPSDTFHYVLGLRVGPGICGGVIMRESPRLSCSYVVINELGLIAVCSA